MMKAHIFITDKNTFPIVRDNGFYGVGVENMPDTLREVLSENIANSKKPYFSIIADILGTRIGDIVFFYERQVGFHGIYQIQSKPFFDPTAIDLVGKTWPFRVRIKCMHSFNKPIPEDYLFLSKEYESKFWGWFYRKIQGPRGINTINPEAAEALTELLVKVNSSIGSAKLNTKPYISNRMEDIVLPLDKDGKVYLEDILRAWLMANIDNPARNDIREIFGPVDDIEWFANNVPYHISRKNIDILCYHKNMKYTGFPLRYKFTVVELKRNTATDDDVNQVINYSKWVAGRLANSEIETIQPVLIAYNFNEKARNKARNSDFSERGIIFYRYYISSGEVYFEREPL